MSKNESLLCQTEDLITSLIINLELSKTKIATRETYIKLLKSSENQLKEELKKEKAKNLKSKKELDKYKTEQNVVVVDDIFKEICILDYGLQNIEKDILEIEKDIQNTNQRSWSWARFIPFVCTSHNSNNVSSKILPKHNFIEQITNISKKLNSLNPGKPINHYSNSKHDHDLNNTTFYKKWDKIDSNKILQHLFNKLIEKYEKLTLSKSGSSQNNNNKIKQILDYYDKEIKPVESNLEKKIKQILDYSDKEIKPVESNLETIPQLETDTNKVLGGGVSNDYEENKQNE